MQEVIFFDTQRNSARDQNLSQNLNDKQTTVTSLRRSTRQKRLLEKFKDYELLLAEYPELLLTDQTEPVTFKQACNNPHSEKRMAAMGEEMDSLQSNLTWELVKLPPNKRALKNRWVYRLKEEEGGRKRYRARLVVKGYDQKKGLDFNEIFSPVVRMTSIRAVLGLVTAKDLELEQLDVKTAFLHGDIEEELYMDQPRGFIKK